MIALTLADISEIVGGAIGAGSDTSAIVDGSVETDSRLVTTGSVFLALPGEETDGHLFVPSAVERGAAARTSAASARGYRRAHDRAESTSRTQVSTGRSVARRRCRPGRFE